MEFHWFINVTARKNKGFGRKYYKKTTLLLLTTSALECAVLEETIPSSLMQTLKKQKYHLIGNHSAVKRCKWLYESIVNGRVCYKEKFYGIKSHQCIQMSPSLYYCTQHCLFCWRAQSGDLQVTWDEMKMPKLNTPEEIVAGSFKAQEKILTGYKGNPKTDLRKLAEAYTPKQVAISLTGEPTLYPDIGELIRTYHQKGLTTFLVTNGTLPQQAIKAESRTNPALHFRLRPKRASLQPSLSATDA